MFLTYLFLVFVFAGVQNIDSAKMMKHPKGAEIRMLAKSDIHKNKNAFIGHLTIPAGGKVPLHQDETEEYIYVLDGYGKIWIDEKKHSIKEGDLIFMPKMAKVRFENGPKTFKGLQVFAGPGPEKKYENWKSDKKIKK